MKMTTNQEDWTGKEVTVRINKAKKTFKLFGENFKIKRRAKRMYYITGESWDCPLGKIHEYEDASEDFRFCAYNESGIERYSKNIFESAIKLLCNII